MVTLAVPIYNVERYLAKCLDSLLAQTCRDYEILLIDDGSTDASAAICDAYAAAHPGLVRVIHKENGGPSSARNAAIDHARGEFIIFPDPDDWVEPEYVELLLKYQQEHQADFVCLSYYVDTDSASCPAMPDEKAVLLTGREGQRGLMLPPGMEGFPWNKLYSMDIIRSHGLRFPDDIAISEDLWFAYHYLAHCDRACHAPAARVYHYCQREDSATQRGFNRDKLDTVTVYDQIIADCAKRDPELTCAACDRLCTIIVNLIWLHENSSVKDPEAKRLLLSHIRRLLPGYLRTVRYGTGRKIQAILAAFSPKAFALLKNLVHKRFF